MLVSGVNAYVKAMLMLCSATLAIIKIMSMVLIYLHQFFGIRSVRFPMSLLAFSKEIIIETPAKQHVTLPAFCVGENKVKAERASRKCIEAKRRCYRLVTWYKGTYRILYPAWIDPPD